MSRDVIVVPHTHWDREWYEAFQTFRMKLVDMVDDLLDLLEDDPGFVHFMLDGQMAAVDDYLEVRPENAVRLRALAANGRLGMGPWYILMDEFLVSGETIIRDLQLGLRRATEFGGAMQVGYLPDMFGHVAQMPQLLSQFGLDHAVVWRGVPAAVERDAFWWSAPDGSTVRAEYLLEGYGNGAALPDDAKDLVSMVAHFVADHESLLTGDVLWMNGTDHLLPKPWLGRVVAEANEIQDDFHFRVTSLADYLSGAGVDGLTTCQGELRSGARANLLMGVGSNRVDIKQLAAQAERGLERLAEPLSALYLPAEKWPARLLDLAWLEMIRNSAHDSSCACSIDEVNQAVRHRYAEARQIADGLTERAVASLVGRLRNPGPVAINPSARPRRGVIEMMLPGVKPVEGTQVLSVSDGRAGTGGLTRDDCVTLVQAAMDGMDELRDVEIDVDDDDVLDVRLVCTHDGSGPRYAGPARSLIKEAAAQHPDGPARIAIATPPSQQVLTWVDHVPGLGWSIVTPGVAATSLPVPVEVTDDHTVTNGLLHLVVDPRTGTFSLDGTAGLGRLVDDGDSGDTYNYSPPAGDSVVDTPTAVEVTVSERGPLRASVRIDRTYLWPDRVLFGERTGEAEARTSTTLEVQAGSPLVRVSTEVHNPSRDHRLRVWFPLPEPATSSTAECAFTLVERGLEAEGGPNEFALPTFPSRRFVMAGGLTVVHEGLLEYELVDIHHGRARALALTLLRCTGLLSNAPMTYRPLPAGPFLPTKDSQMPGSHTFRYGLQAGTDTSAAFAAVDEAFLPLIVTTAPGGGDADDRGTALTVTGAEVSSIQRDQGGLVVRVFNPSGEPTQVRIDGRHGWLVDLRGTALAPFEDGFDLGPHQIATARVTDAGS